MPKNISSYFRLIYHRITRMYLSIFCYRIVLYCLVVPGYFLTWLIIRYVHPNRARLILAKLGKSFNKKASYSILHTNKRGAIWIHGVSAGEINASRYLIHQLQKENYPIYLTTSTQSGLIITNQIQIMYPNQVQVDVFPLDIPILYRKIFKIVQPQAVILLECELWPNFLLECQRQHVPTMLVNGRLYKKELKQYQCLAPLFKKLCDIFNFVSVQSQQDAQRFEKLGVSKHRLYTDGNLKIDSVYLQDNKHQEKQLKQSIHKDSFVILAASTHSKEQNLFLKSFQRIKHTHPNLTISLIIAPRKQKDIKILNTQIRNHNLCKRSWKEISIQHQYLKLSQTDVLIIDTMGDLFSFYKLADIVIQGGTFQKGIGGHNLLEPLYHHNATIIGPFDDAIQWLSIGMSRHGGIHRITESINSRSILEIQLSDVISRWIHSPKIRQQVIQQIKTYQFGSPSNLVYRRILKVLFDRV